MKRLLFPRGAAVVLACALVLPAAFGARAAEEARGDLNRLSREEISEGWIKLFDGESLFGWTANNDVNWSAAGGVISADRGEPGLLVTTSEFADYELRCDFRLERGGNSGIFLRTVFRPTDPTKDCYELNICDTHPAFPTGSLVGLVKTGLKIEAEGQWHTYHVVAEGNRIQVRLDGREVLTYTDERPGARRSGYIGLQKNAGRAEYRNVYLRPLGVRPIFGGKDLAGWREVPGGKSRFEVDEGAIQVKSGPGFLETEPTWADFVFQAEIRTNGRHLNSGIFFRAQPGTAEHPSNGYEAQILNAWEGDDRTKPLDFGTGGIHRRMPARRIVADDLEWFTMTIATSGPHIGVWVDGEPVADWTDTRKPDENPRRGLRTEAGHIILQGHDEKTDLSFRKLRVAELPE